VAHLLQHRHQLITGSLEMGKKNKYEMPTDEQLMERGYMTIDQFVDRFSESLRGYMYSNWPSTQEELHHPEDLASNAAVYTEVMCRVIGDFS
jgi:hypothetical protein